MSYTSSAVQEALFAGYSGPRRPSRLTEVTVPRLGLKTGHRCKTCGLPTRADVVTTYRNGKTYETTFFRCQNARVARLGLPGRPPKAKPKCEVEKTEVEINEMAPIEKKAPQPASWIEKIRTRLKERNLTLLQLSEMAGSSRSEISKALSPDYGATPTLVSKIEGALWPAEPLPDTMTTTYVSNTEHVLDPVAGTVARIEPIDEIAKLRKTVADMLAGLEAAEIGKLWETVNHLVDVLNALTANSKAKPQITQFSMLAEILCVEEPEWFEACVARAKRLSGQVAR